MNKGIIFASILTALSALGALIFLACACSFAGWALLSLLTFLGSTIPVTAVTSLVFGLLALLVKLFLVIGS